MAFNIVLTHSFKKELRQIAKKHKSILKDISSLINELAETPTKGIHLGQGLYKIRLSITGTTKGKSGGARVITYVKIINETVVLTEIYLKSDFDTVNVDIVIKNLINEGFI